MIKKRLLVAMVLSTLFVLGACASNTEKEIEQSEAPAINESEVIAETEADTDVDDAEEEILAINEENQAQAVELATTALTSFFKKSDEYTDEDRREALRELTHSEYTDHLEMQHSLLDVLDSMKIDNVEMLTVEIQDVESSEDELLQRYAILYGFKEVYVEPGEEEVSDDDSHLIVFVMIDDNQFKISGFANLIE